MIQGGLYHAKRGLSGRHPSERVGAVSATALAPLRRQREKRHAGIFQTSCRLSAFRSTTQKQPRRALGGAMSSKRKLLAAVTASGAVLCLSVSADSSVYSPATQSINPFPELLSLRVEQLREKLRSTSPSDDGAANDKIDNIVQFFNFYNCMRPGWRNC